MSKPAWLIIMSIGLLASGSARAQQAGIDSRVPHLERRLSGLDGTDAVAYLELAEEVADEATSAVEVRLARALYTLAFEVDRASGWESRVGGSACLGLAALETLDDERRWLRALATRVDPRYRKPETGALPGEGPPIPAEVRLEAAEAIGAARAGDGVRARRGVDKPGVPEALNRFSGALGLGGASSVARYVEALARGWPCPQCHGERVVDRRAPGGAVVVERCPTCQGDPGTALTPEQFAAHMRFEARLLDADVRSWAGQLAVDRGAPLRDPEPDELAAFMRVDPRAVLWRDGAWVVPDTPDGEEAPGVQDEG